MDSTQYDTSQAESVFFIINLKYLGENETKFEKSLTHWSVEQAGSNDEKKLGVKNLVRLSL